MIKTNLIIDGEWRPAASGDFIELNNPARPDETVGQAASASGVDINRAVDAARGAAPQWAALTFQERAAYLEKVAQQLSAKNDDLQQRIALLTKENGKVLRESAMELTRLGDRFAFCATLASQLEAEQRLNTGPFDTLITHQSRGVTALFLPWNWPLSILGANLPQALLAGNTVVIKFSERCCLSPMLTLRVIASLFPPGVINVVTGTVEQAATALLNHPDVQKVSFTGSVEAGRQVMHQCAESLKHLTLELGGNDPALVLDDAQLGPEELQRMAMACLMTAGQVCMAIKRIYVHRSRYSELVEGLTAAASRHVIGDGLDPEVTMGPLNSRHQLDRLRLMLNRAEQGGAKLHKTGTIKDASLFKGGYFHQPTIVTGATQEMDIVAEEQFGPAIPIIPFDNDDQAVTLANDCRYGLCSSVWSSDPSRATSIARQIESGYTYLNGHGPMAQDNRAPFGGVKQSGFGRVLGMEGVREFMQPHSISAPGGWLF